MICDVYKRVSCLRRGTVALTPFQIIQGEIISCSVTGSWNIDLIKQKVKWWKLQIQLKINSLQLFMQLLWCTQICRIMLYDLLKIYYRGQKAKFRLSVFFFFGLVPVLFYSVLKLVIFSSLSLLLCSPCQMHWSVFRWFIPGGICRPTSGGTPSCSLSSPLPPPCSILHSQTQLVWLTALKMDEMIEIVFIA